MIPPATPLDFEEKGTSQNCIAHGAAVNASEDRIDADLQMIVNCWTDLPDAMKAGIVAMVRALRG